MTQASLFLFSLFFFFACTDDTDGPDRDDGRDGTEESTQDEDRERLMEQFAEIQELSNSVSCDNADEWSFTAYGSKACGGPQGYIAYANTTDERAFLDLVEQHSDAEMIFNEKWAIISDCAVVSPPSYVICREGLPVLIFNCSHEETDTTSPCNDVPPTDEECDAAFERWFYVRASNTCEQIGYSGCEQYGFASLEDCETCLCTEG